MKRLINLLRLPLVALLFMVSCSVEPVETSVLSLENQNLQDPTPCDNEDPKAKITNDSDIAVDMQIYDENDVLINHAYGVPPGDESGWLTFDPGNISVVVSSTSSNKAIRLEMDMCMTYHVTIDENYQLDTDQPTQL